MGKKKINHAGGKKFSKTHTSYISAASDLLKVITGLPEVSKISLGRITPKLPPGQTRYKFEKRNGGWRITVVGQNAKQTFMVYTRSPDETKEAILKTTTR